MNVKDTQSNKKAITIVQEFSVICSLGNTARELRGSGSCPCPENAAFRKLGPQYTAQCVYSSIACECDRSLAVQILEHRQNLKQGPLAK
jgi:hypothetical protein